MENNEQNNIEATNNVNPVNNVEPTPAVEATPEVKTEDTIMVAEPAARPVSTPMPAVQPTPAPVAQPQETVAQQPVAPVEPTVAVEPVVIPKGEKTKSNNMVVILLVLVLILLGICGYFVYDKYIKGDKPTTPNTNEPTNNNQQTNNNEPTPTPDVEPEPEPETGNTEDEPVSESVLSTEDGIYEKMPVGNDSIGESLTIRNIRYVRMDGTDLHTFDIYLDDKLVVEGYVDNYPVIQDDAEEYKGIYLAKIGNVKDNEIDASYLAFTVGPYIRTLYIIDKDGQVLFQKSGTKGANAGGFIVNATKERFKDGDFKYVSMLDTNTNENIDMILTYSGDFNTQEGIVKSIKVNSGVAVESVYKTYTSGEVALTGR